MYERFHVFFYILISVTITFFFSQEVAFSASSVSTSTISITAVVPSSGGGGETPAPTEVNFFGKAYPNSTVAFLKEAVFVENTTANFSSDFEINATGLTGGTYLFSFYSEDLYGTQSSLVTMSVDVVDSATTIVSNIFLPPTINTDKSSVKQEENITIFGQTTGGSDVIIEFGLASTSSSTIAIVEGGGDGLYEYILDTTALSLGDYNVKAKTDLGAVETSYSKIISFSIEEKEEEEPDFLMADLNDDGKVDVVDFSIAAFWYKQILSEDFALIEAERLNNDGKINLIDFSMIAYYWTG